MSEAETENEPCSSSGVKKKANEKDKRFSIEDLEDMFLKDNDFFNKLMDKKKADLELQNQQKLEQLEALKRRGNGGQECDEPQPSTSGDQGRSSLNINVNAQTDNQITQDR